MAPLHGPAASLDRPSCRGPPRARRAARIGLGAAFLGPGPPPPPGQGRPAVALEALHAPPLGPRCPAPPRASTGPPAGARREPAGGRGKEGLPGGSGVLL